VTTARDGRNNPTTIEYDATFKLLPVRITNAATHVQQLEYFGFNGVPRDGNQAGLLKRVIDANNAITSYGYDPFGRLTRVIRPFDSWNSPSEFYSYHDYGSNRLTAGPFLIGTWRKTQNNAGTYTTGGVFERNFYDGFGRLVQVQRPYTNWGGSGVGQEVVVDMGYNAAGQMVRQSRPYLRAAYTYGTVNGLVINPYHPPDTNQPRVTHAYDALGQTVRSVNLDGGVTSGIYGLRSAYTQDANNNIRAAYTDMVGQLVAVDEMTNRFSDTFDNANLPGWNKAGNVSVTGGVVRLTGDGTWGTNIRRNLQTTGEDGVTFSFRTNSVNNVATMFLHQGSWGNSNYRRWAIMLSGGQIIKQEYSGTTLTSDTLMPLKANTWYRAALITSRSNVNHRLVVWEENNPANFAEVRLPKDNSWKQHGWQFMVQMNTSGATLDLDNYAEFDFYRTRYEYDLSGNLRKVTNPLGHVTEMWYDALGRKTSMRDPDMSNPANSGSRWWYSYDNAGNLTQQTDAKGQVIAFVYDNLNRLTEKKQGSTVLAVYGYDAGSNGKGRRTSMTAYVGETNSASWTYDARGRVTNEYRTVAGSSYRFHFTYTQGDLPLTIRYPAGPGNQLGETVTTHYYWPTGQPRRLVGDSVYVDETTYREFGAPSQVNMGSNIVNIYGYDAAMRTNHIRYHVGGSNRFRLGLNYDKVGNVMSIQDYTPPGGGSTQWQYFTYDSLNRLTNAYTSGGNAGDYNQTYAYNALGNFTQKAGLTMGYGQTSGIAANARPHAVTHLGGSQKFWYDHNGNMTRRIDENNKDWTYTWTVDNRLARATTAGGDDVRFVYDADGAMVLRNDNGQRTVFLGNLYQRNLSTGAQTKHYLFGGKLVAMRQDNNAANFLLTDHLGSVNVTLNADGTIRSRLRYDPWGKQRYAQNNTPTDYRYTAQRFDNKLGIYDYRARYYDPHIARFLSADTLVPDRKNPQQFNRYTYTLNNPLRFADPTGHCAGDPGQPGECYESTPSESRKRRINATVLGYGASSTYNFIAGSLGLSQGHFLLQEGFELVPGTTYSGQVIVRGSHGANEAVGLSPYLRHAKQSHGGIQPLLNPGSAAAANLASKAARGTALMAVGANVLDYGLGDNSEYGIFSTHFAAANTVDLATGLGFPATGAGIGSLIAPGPGTFLGAAAGVVADLVFTFTARNTVVAGVNDIYQEEAARWSLVVDSQSHNTRAFSPSILPYIPYDIQPTYTNARTLGISSTYPTVP
jgi:RHS repeat-associated protein